MSLMHRVIVISLLSVLSLAKTAVADPGATPLTVHDPFQEKGRFTLRGLSLEGGGNVLTLERGGRITGQVDLVQHCADCGGSINQIIVGLAGDPRAQACIYNGPGRSGGWERASFTIDVPDAAGVYEIRARYAQARQCGEALAWWRVDRPQGPRGDATIGVVVVSSPEPAERTREQVREDIDGALQQLDEVTRRLVKITRKKMPPPLQIQAAKLSGEAHNLTRTLLALQAELRDLGKGGGGHGPRPHGFRPRPQVVVHADPLPQQIVVVQAPGPIEPLVQPMRPPEFDKLLKSLNKAAFEESQLAYLGDVLRTNPWFTADQAVAVMKVFPFSSGQVEAGVMLCDRILDPGAFLPMVEMLTWDSDRDALRSRTGGTCGPK
jgi:hypothetical protein